MLLRCQSFDSSTTMSDYDSRLLTPSIAGGIQQNGAFGANFLRCYSYVTNFLQGFKPIPAGVNGFSGFRFRSNGVDYMFFGVVDETAAIHLGFKISPLGEITVARMNGRGNPNDVAATLFTSAVGVIPTAGFCYLELGWVIGTGTAGSVVVRLNNQQIFAATGITTQGTASVSGTTAAYYLYGHGDVQDIYIADGTGPAPSNAFFGDVRVYEASPNGAGATTTFTPTGAATNWQVAAQVSPTPATVYNSSSTVGAADLYTIGAIPTGLGTIFGVQVNGTLSKTDAGARTATLSIKSGAVTAAGASHSLQISPTTYMEVFNVDPATSAAFTAAGVNALQFGPTILT